MTTMLRMGAAGAIAAVALASAPAYAADNADATAKAEILSALTLTLETGSSLDFGGVVMTGAGSLTMDADGTLDCSDTNLVCSGSTDVPIFDVTGGSANKAIKINLPSAISLYKNGTTAGTATAQQILSLGNFTTDGVFNASATTARLDQYGDPVPDLGTDPSGATPFYDTAAAYWSVTLDGSGEGRFSVGGDLDFDGDEEVGGYTGTFNVSVEYS